MSSAAIAPIALGAGLIGTAVSAAGAYESGQAQSAASAYQAQVVFAVEKLADVYNEARPLLPLHWQEIARNKGLLTLNPDLDAYTNGAEKLLLITARFDRRLIGYFLWVTAPHPHYKHVLTAQEDLHFLLPEYRRGLTGYNLLKAARDAAVAKGAKLLAVREKVGHEHPALWKRLGFAPTDIVYTYAAVKG
jgi:GNAT superfamily N-acetyltransferase